MSNIGDVSPAPRDATRARMLLAAAIATVVIAGIAAAPPLIDDAFISFRYAKNLATGRGLVFNMGEWVEGYSNLSWVLVAAGIERLGLPIETAVRVLGLACCAGTIALIWLYTIRRRLPLHAAAAGIMAVACSALWLRSSLNGLESPLVSLITVALLVMAVPTDGWRLGHSVGAGTLLILAMMTRPEGQFLWVAYAMGLGCQALFPVDSGAGHTRVTWRPLAIAILVFVLGLAAVMFWRYSTYHALVPNTIVAKLGDESPLSRPLWLYGFGLRYVGHFALAIAPLLLATLGLLFSWHAILATLPALALLTFGLLVPIPNGGDWMPEYRLVAPYIPVAGILAAEGIATVVRARSPVRWAAAAAVILTTAWTSWASVDPNPAAWGRMTPLFRPQRLWSPDSRSGFGDLGAALQQSTLPPDARIASEVLGEFSYYAMNRHVIDLSGLTDRTIALEEPLAFRFGRKTRPSTLQRLAPAVLIFNDFSYWEELATHRWFVDRYVPITCEHFYRDGLFAFVMSGSPLASGGPLVAGCDAGVMTMSEAIADVKRWRAERRP
jgi:hypothetical protein